MTRRKNSNLLPRCLLKHKYGGDAPYDLEETKQSAAKTDEKHMSMDDKKESMGDKKESMDDKKESMDDKKESTDNKKESMDVKKEFMGDENCHNSNRVEVGGAQGGNFVDSQVHNNTSHIHS